MNFKLYCSIYLCWMLLGFKANSQNASLSCVTYKVDRYSYENDKTLSNDEQLKAFRSLEYQLVYNNSQSIYKPIDKLYEGENIEYYNIAKMYAGNYFFKDLISKEKVELSDAGDESFYVIKNFDEYKWEITNETKIIDGYTCIKATAYKEEVSLLRNTIRKFYPIVWFAPEIPSPFGPYGLDGLPGLVLEATYNGRIYFYATKIDLNCISEISLEKPKKGKFVTEVEFLKLVNEVKQNLLNSGR